MSQCHVVTMAWSPRPDLGCTKHLPPLAGPHWKGLARCKNARGSGRICLFTALNGLRHVVCDSSSRSLSCRTSVCFTNEAPASRKRHICRLASLPQVQPRAPQCAESRQLAQCLPHLKLLRTREALLARAEELFPPSVVALRSWILTCCSTGNRLSQVPPFQLPVAEPEPLLVGSDQAGIAFVPGTCQ